MDKELVFINMLDRLRSELGNLTTTAQAATALCPDYQHTNLRRTLADGIAELNNCLAAL